MTRQTINGVIRKIILFYYPYDGMLGGIRFYDVTGQMIYESADKWQFTRSDVKQHEILL